MRIEMVKKNSVRIDETPVCCVICCEVTATHEIDSSTDGWINIKFFCKKHFELMK